MVTLLEWNQHFLIKSFLLVYEALTCKVKIFIDKLQILETKEVVQLGKLNNWKQEELYNYGEEEDILQESSCI